MVIKSRRKRWEKHVTSTTEMTNANKILVVKSDRKRTLERRRSRWEDNIRLDVREIGWKGVNWIYLVQERHRWRALLYTVMNLRVP
jgi:hypothetical protein